jgi:hypothetical protein
MGVKRAVRKLAPNGACVSAMLEAYSRRPPRHPRIRCSSMSLEITPTRNFPGNAPPNFTEYLSERPEMIPHDEKLKKAKTIKGNNTYENKIS